MAKPVRIGVIGCGVIAATHVESFQQVDGAEVAWACDLKPDRAGDLAAKYSISRVTTDYREVLADPSVDLVSICTDHASHASIACDAMEADKHIVVEKALAASREGLRQMLDAHAARPHLVFAGVFQHRFEGINRRLRDMVAEGAFGTVLTASMQLRCRRTDAYYSDDWHGTWDKEGGSVLINQAIHFVDAISWIMDGAESVSAAYANRVHPASMETEDTLTAAVRFRSGALGTLEATCGSHLNWEYSLAVHGAEGSVELRNDKLTKLVFADPTRQAEARAALENANDPQGVAAGKAYYGVGHRANLADVIDAIRDGREPFVTGEAAAKTVDLVLSAYESARSGGWVRVGEPATASKA